MIYPSFDIVFISSKSFPCWEHCWRGRPVIPVFLATASNADRSPSSASPHSPLLKAFYSAATICQKNKKKNKPSICQISPGLVNCSCSYLCQLLQFSEQGLDLDLKSKTNNGLTTLSKALNEISIIQQSIDQMMHRLSPYFYFQLLPPFHWCSQFPLPVNHFGLFHFHILMHKVQILIAFLIITVCRPWIDQILQLLIHRLVDGWIFSSSHLWALIQLQLNRWDVLFNWLQLLSSGYCFILKSIFTLFILGLTFDLL